MADLVPAVYYCISIPAATEDILLAVGDILATGTAAADNLENIEEIRQVLVMLGVTASLVSCQT